MNFKRARSTILATAFFWLLLPEPGLAAGSLSANARTTPQIEVSARFFETTWFFLLCGGLALSILAVFYFWRFRLLKHTELKVKEHRLFLENEVQNRTAELQQEIAERKRAEAELASSLSMLNATLDSTLDGMLVVDGHGRLIIYNRKFVEMWQISEEVLSSRQTEQVIASVRTQLKDPDKYFRHASELYTDPEAETFEVLEFKDGRVFERYSKPQRVDGVSVGRVSCFRDITERRHADAELRWKTALLEAQMESSIDGLLIVDNTGKKVLQNQRTSDLWKLPPEIANGDDDAKQIQFVLDRTKHPEQFVAKVRHLYSHPNENSRDEIEFKDGMVLDRYSAPVLGKDGTHYGRIWAFRDITERKRAEAALRETHQQLLKASRQAGMAEVATDVLHNVGNVLNSVNVSATIVADHVRQSQLVTVAKIGALLEQHKEDLADFLTNDPRGQTLPAYLASLGEILNGERQTVIEELDNLLKHVGHITAIVSAQQSYAGAKGFFEAIAVPDLIEEALRMNTDSLEKHAVVVRRDYQARPVVTTDKHKVLQILNNLVRNAKYACNESGRTDKQITVHTTSDEHSVRIAVIDNGVGIPLENLTRIFNHGFTTRQGGHGFGLHSGALAAKEIGGALNVQSAGLGHGATFTLELPLAIGDPPA